MKSYNPKNIEKKQQKAWESKKIYQAKDSSKKKNYYCLVEFPYPSGDGLHVGHVRSYTALDVLARKKRMEGFNVLYPMGWDAFGLPAENYAIKTKIHPSITTKKNIQNFKKQMNSLGLSFDWSREINTTDPEYYRWTQWIFLQFLKHDLAYKARIPINWCPKDKIGLANEEVVDGKCERCGTSVVKKEKEQWMLRITKYADRLYKDLDSVDYLEKIKLQQRNWIGKSEGAEIDFVLTQGGDKITVFTTRPDTIFGATYVVLAPEHSLLEKLIQKIENKEEVERYVHLSKNKTEIERGAENKEKTGVCLKGVKVINPATQKEIPVWVADYVLGGYGTGALMAVPAHDERDFAFAKKYKLSIRRVLNSDTDHGNIPHEYKNRPEDYIQHADSKDFCFTGEAPLMNSGIFDGKHSSELKKEITQYFKGRWVTKFKLRDWVFSRQRYWGEPIPVIHCEKCGIVPVPEKELPVKLPKVKNYEPTDTGESPLSNISSWVNTKCPKCRGFAKRETDVMPNWAGSSWYFLRYIDPKNKKKFADPKKLKKWMGVDWYNGGMEHTTLHLLYSRFWTKFLYDHKHVPVAEPYKKRTSHGLILAQGGEKMSKSKGNVVNPDSVIEMHGADTLRLYEMFIGPFDQAVSWSTEGIVGPYRFIEKIWRIAQNVSPNKKIAKDPNLESLLRKTIQKVGSDIEEMNFNTAVSSLMIFANECEKKDVSYELFSEYMKLLAPFIPHVADEIWHIWGGKRSIHEESWPKAEKFKDLPQQINIAIQVNGKVRASLSVLPDSSKEDVKKEAFELPEVRKWLVGKEIVKEIFVPGRILNIVIR